MTDFQPTKTERVAARCAAGLNRHDHPPVVVRPGDAAPALSGERWYYQTRGGTRINHPHAYSQVGWSSMVYRPSTRRVEVGADWLRAATHSVTITDCDMVVAA